MTSDDQNMPPEEPTQPVPIPPAVPAASEPAPAPSAGGPRLGHIVLGAILVLIGVGWLLEALGAAEVPWRFLLPAALIIVGVALVFGARTGTHGGLVAVGVVLTVLVVLAGAVDALVDVPFVGGFGDKSYRPTTAVEDEYRWGFGKMTLDLRDAGTLVGEEIEASVVLGELVVIVPPDLPVVVTAHAGVGDLVVLGEQSDGVDVDLECQATGEAIACGDEEAGGRPFDPSLRLDLEVGVGKVEVQR
jgi:hypothetical protein